MRDYLYLIGIVTFVSTATLTVSTFIDALLFVLDKIVIFVSMATLTVSTFIDEGLSVLDKNSYFRIHGNTYCVYIYR